MHLVKVHSESYSCFTHSLAVCEDPTLTEEVNEEDLKSGKFDDWTFTDNTPEDDEDPEGTQPQDIFSPDNVIPARPEGEDPYSVTLSPPVEDTPDSEEPDETTEAFMDFEADTDNVQEVIIEVTPEDDPDNPVTYVSKSFCEFD